MERQAAIELVATIKVDVAKKVGALTAALADPSCRARATTELGKLGTAAKTAVPTLMKLKLDPDLQVRDAAAAAIDLIREQ
jgi:hypothetical protein